MVTSYKTILSHIREGSNLHRNSRDVRLLTRFENAWQEFKDESGWSAVLSVWTPPVTNQSINQLIGQCQCVHYTVPAPVAFAYRWRAIHKVTNTLSLKPPPPHLPNPNKRSAPFHIKPRHNPNDSILSCNIIATSSLYFTFHYVCGAGENIWIYRGGITSSMWNIILREES